jgi:hypothetical protein
VVASGATIGGTTKRLQTNTNWEGFGWAGKLAWWLAVSISTLVVGLLLIWLIGRGASTVLEAGRTRIGPSIGLGLLLFFGLPILAIIALVTVVGIPLGLGLLAALLLIYALGYSATAWILGRSIVREPTTWVVAFLVGWAILRVVALVPILGGLVWFAAVVIGLGALALAIWRARSASQATAATRPDATVYLSPTVTGGADLREPEARRYLRIERNPAGAVITRTYTFPGGCVTQRLVAPEVSRQQLASESSSALSFTTRDTLATALRRNSHGRLDRDVRTE